MRPYSVYIPDNYAFGDGICSELRFDPNYQPPFVTTENFQITEEGMRWAVVGEGGTARAADLPYVSVAGKTGTAEYCDEIAWPLGLCRPGNWPAHAWFTAYAPYEDPNILMIGFVYNGGEGSGVALPIVVNTMQEYFRLQNERGENTLEAIPGSTETDTAVPAATAETDDAPANSTSPEDNPDAAGTGP
jgi:membrane peptidoglycan carboxypeptidase